MRVQPELVRRELQEPQLDLERILAGRQAACDSRRGTRACRRRSSVRRTRRSSRRWRSCGPTPGQLLERVAIARHFAAMLVEQDLRQRDDVLRLHVEKADRADVRHRAPRRRARRSPPACWRPRTAASVALFTPLSVACADSTTATSSSNGVGASSSLVGSGLAARSRSKIWRRLAGFIGCDSNAVPTAGERGKRRRRDRRRVARRSTRVTGCASSASRASRAASLAFMSASSPSSAAPSRPTAVPPRDRRVRRAISASSSNT